MFLLLGSSGYVGSAFRRHFEAQGLPFACLSLKNTQESPRLALTQALRTHRPTFVLSAAGYAGVPNVDATEVHKAECLEANLSTPVVMADVCREFGIPLGHVSTGCFYQGTKADGSGFAETDAPNFDFRHNNAGFYSGCKALAEEVLAEYPQIYLWRLRYPFSRFHHKKNYLSKLLRYDKLVEAQNSISELEEFATECTRCMTEGLPFGKYNVTNPGFVTTREVVELLKKHNMAPGRTFQFFADESEFMKEAATVPRANCVLNVDKIMNLGAKLTEVHDAIEICLKDWQAAGYPN